MPDIDDEELIDDLPPLDLNADEETLDADDLGVESMVTQGDETVGLDDSTGLEDAAPLFALDLPPEDAAGDDAETDLDAIPVEGIDAGDEYGWADDGHGGEDPIDPDDLDMPSLTPLGRDDGGEEGVEERFELGELPPLQADLDDDEEPIDDPMFDVLDVPEPAPMLPGPYESRVCVAARLTPAVPVRSVLVTERAVWAVGDAIFAVTGDEAERVAAEGLEERRSLALAAGDDGHRLVVGTDRGIARSVDRGRGFQLGGAMASGAFRVVREPDTDRIWAWSGEGALHRSDDLGGVWSGPQMLGPVAAMRAPRGEGVYALCGPVEERWQLARSTDGGQRWAAFEAPELPEGTVSLSVHGALVAVASGADPRGPHLSADGGRRWLRVPGLPTTDALAVCRERGGVSIYAAHRGDGGRAVVVRHRPDGDDAGAVLELTDPSATIAQVVAVLDSETRTRLFVATSVGLYRVTLTLGGP